MSTSCITTIAQQHGTNMYICCLVMVRWSLLTFDQLYVFYCFLDIPTLRLQYLKQSIFRIPFLLPCVTGYERFLHSKDGTKTAGIHLSISPETRWLLDSTHLTMASELPWTERFFHWTHLQIPQKHPTCTTAVLVSFFFFFLNFQPYFFLGQWSNFDDIIFFKWVGSTTSWIGEAILTCESDAAYRNLSRLHLTPYAISEVSRIYINGGCNPFEKNI